MSRLDLQNLPAVLLETEYNNDTEFLKSLRSNTLGRTLSRRRTERIAELLFLP